ncbi:MAG: ribonuclease P protein component [Prevotella sp.]|nr:ribonuclease P protein component [Prevotella sp.]
MDVENVRHMLRKSQRLTSRQEIDELFSGGSKALTVHPLRVVYKIVSNESDDKTQQPQAKVMFSVPKKFFKRAVKRNRIKRQMREAYRNSNDILTTNGKTDNGKQLLMAFIWTDDQLLTTDKVTARMQQALTRIAEKCRQHLTS